MSSSFLEKFRNRMQKINKNGEFDLREQYPAIPMLENTKIHEASKIPISSLYNTKKFTSRRFISRYQTPMKNRDIEKFDRSNSSTRPAKKKELSKESLEISPSKKKNIALAPLCKLRYKSPEGVNKNPAFTNESHNSYLNYYLKLKSFN